MPSPVFATRNIVNPIGAFDKKGDILFFFNDRKISPLVKDSL